MAIPWRIYRYRTISSTQTLALAHARRLLMRQTTDAPGALVAAYVARTQTHGYGQHGRRWRSPPGGLYLSAVFAPWPVEDTVAGQGLAPLLPLAMGVGIVRAARSRGLTAVLRWPNDILLDDKKIAGVLCQGVCAGQRRSLVVGVGININNDPCAWGGGWKSLATSWRASMGRSYHLEAVLHEVLRRLDTAARQVLAGAGRRAALLAAIGRLDALAGRLVTVRSGGVIVTGRAAGITVTGALRLRTGQGWRQFETAAVEAVDGEAIRPKP